MDFTFNDQQNQFRDAVRSFLVVEAAPERLREYWETPTGRSAEMRQKITDQGITALSVPEDHGGMGMGDEDWVQILEQVGYHGIPDSLSDSAYLGVFILNSLPDECAEFKKEWLERMVAGEARIAVSHPVNPLVHDAEIADLVFLWHNDEFHATSADRLTTRLNPSIDQSRRLYSVDWTPSDESRVLGAEAGKQVWEDAVNRAALAAAAQLTGLAQCMLDLSIDYAAQRKQFGKPVGSFQAVKHHLANVAVQIEFAAPVVYRAANAMATNHPRRAAFVSHAKLAAGRAARLSARNGIQAHGAMGYTWEADLQMYMKRAWALDAAWGDSAFHKARMAEFIFADDAPLGPGETFTS